MSQHVFRGVVGLALSVTMAGVPLSAEVVKAEVGVAGMT